MSSGKERPFCLGLDVLNVQLPITLFIGIPSNPDITKYTTRVIDLPD